MPDTFEQFEANLRKANELIARAHKATNAEHWRGCDLNHVIEQIVRANDSLAAAGNLALETRDRQRLALPQEDPPWTTPQPDLPLAEQELPVPQQTATKKHDHPETTKTPPSATRSQSSRSK